MCRSNLPPGLLSLEITALFGFIYLRGRLVYWTDNLISLLSRCTNTIPSLKKWQSGITSAKGHRKSQSGVMCSTLSPLGDSVPGQPSGISDNSGWYRRHPVASTEQEIISTLHKHNIYLTLSPEPTQAWIIRKCDPLLDVAIQPSSLWWGGSF